jgi:putative oxidoreductase
MRICELTLHCDRPKMSPQFGGIRALMIPSERRELTMKRASSWLRWGPAIFMGLFFVLQGTTKLFGSASVQWAVRFMHWGYPAWFSQVVGVVEIASGLACFIPQSHKIAAVALIVLMAGALSTHLVHGEYLRAIPPLVIVAMAVLLFGSASPKAVARAAK